MLTKTTVIRDKYKILRWILLGIIVIGGFVTAKLAVFALIFYIVPTIFSFLHGTRLLGRKNIFIFFITICLVSYLAEYFGVHTGVIFGQYYYNTVGNGPLLGGVPLLLMLTYFSIAYASFVLARILIGKFDVIKKWGSIIGFSFLGALLMSATDLANDPVASTVNHIYIWVNGGGFFGVPYQNFIGWIAETFVFFIIISIIFAFITKAPKIQNGPSKSFLYEALILFVAPLLPIVLRPLWMTTNTSIYQAMSLIALFILGIPVVTAIMRIQLKKT